MVLVQSDASESCACVVQEREAAQRAAELATRALAAEKRLVEAMKDEAAASSELLEAERAAKFAAQVSNSFSSLKLCMALDLGLLTHCHPALSLEIFPGFLLTFRMV